ncbi:MAG: hypothetical protein A4E67_01453 [Syntrophaceae bacterium PtaB.Bin038]|nr:MAG: hypothetical protein A4E67_01453 [Syntrophaceae bacterium PtaB.Bin038]
MTLAATARLSSGLLQPVRRTRCYAFAHPVETMKPNGKKGGKKDEKKAKPPKVKKAPGREKAESARYWYDPDCGPIYPD